MLVLLLVVAAPCAAQERAADEINRSPHTAESTAILGAKIGQISAFPLEREAEFGAGLGVFVETTLVEGWLELEVGFSAFYLPGADEYELPIDVLLKKPFCFGDVVQMYLALGLTGSVGIGNEIALGIGGAAVVGSYFWLNPDVGLDVEVDYAALAVDGELVQELTIAAGIVGRI